MKTLLTITLSFVSIVASAHNTEHIITNPVVYPPVVTVPEQPSVVLVTPEIKKPTIIYRWVPIYVNRPVTIINNRLFSRTERITYQTTIEWVYQPFYVY